MTAWKWPDARGLIQNASEPRSFRDRGSKFDRPTSMDSTGKCATKAVLLSYFRPKPSIFTKIRCAGISPLCGHRNPRAILRSIIAIDIIPFESEARRVSVCTSPVAKGRETRPLGGDRDAPASIVFVRPAVGIKASRSHSLPYVIKSSAGAGMCSQSVFGASSRCAAARDGFPRTQISSRWAAKGTAIATAKPSYRPPSRSMACDLQNRPLAYSLSSHVNNELIHAGYYDPMSAVLQGL